MFAVQLVLNGTFPSPISRGQRRLPASFATGPPLNECRCHLSWIFERCWCLTYVPSEMSAADRSLGFMFRGCYLISRPDVNAINRAPKRRRSSCKLPHINHAAWQSTHNHIDFVSEPKKLEFCLWVLRRTTTAVGVTARVHLSRFRKSVWYQEGGGWGVKGHSGLKTVLPEPD